MQEINHKTVLVSANGGIIDYVTPDGEVLFSIDVPAGRVAAGEYLDLCPEGARVEIGNGLVAVQPKSWAARQATPYHLDSGANPDFQPTSADRLQRQMRLTMAQMQADQRRIDARLAALQVIERIPTAPVLVAAPQPSQTEGGEVVE